MRKIFFKKRKKVKAYNVRKGIGRIIPLAATICLLAGVTLTVYGNELEEDDMQAPKVVITEIHHKHAGNPDEMGGCYSVSIPHQHQGDEKSGGDCYQTLKYHSHTGNASEEGGCYTQPVYHQHEGDEQHGGGCYDGIPHIHVDECCQRDDCEMHHTLTGEVLETWDEVCPKHGMTTFGKSMGIATHMDCGIGEEQRNYRYCLACGSIAPTYHSYWNHEKLICPIEEGTVQGYRLSCGKDEETIDGYKTECGYEEGQWEKYVLSCEKTIDGYILGCGFNEGGLWCELIVTNETKDQAEQAVLSARLEDMTGGSLQAVSPRFEWWDAEGKLIGTGERISVAENGRYTVVVKLEAKDVDEADLRSSILVDNIYKTEPDITPGPTHTPAPAPTHTPAPTSAPIGGGDTSSTDEEPPVEKEEPEPDMVVENNESIEAAGDLDNNGQMRKSAGVKKSSEPDKTTPSPLPTRKPVMKESQEVKQVENEAREDISYVTGQTNKNAGLFANPVVRMITITGGVFLLLAGVFFLLFYFRHSVKLYNDDGEGRMIRLGRCMVKMEEECYVTTITEAMIENSYTNRYRIKPGLFLLGKKEGQELTVYKGEKSVTVYLDREMIVMI